MEFCRLIAAARDAIGVGESDDLVIRPVAASTHASGNWLQVGLGACGIISGAWGSMRLFKIREPNLLEPR